MTPVIYRPQMFDGRVRMSWIVVKYNPLNAVLELVRQPLLTGEYADLWNWQMAFLFLGVVAILAWWSLRKLENNLVFWV
jgi:ABC-type polysaccharide/polyol phosphate export permease